MEKEENPNQLTQSQIEDLRLAATTMKGVSRRAFPAEICLKYCDGNAKYAEAVFDWGRKNVQVGLEEQSFSQALIFLNKA